MNSIFSVGNTIQLSQGILKPSNKNWCKIKHPLSIHISKYTIFEKLEKCLPNIELNLIFNSIDEILKIEIGRQVNLVAVATLAKETEKNLSFFGQKRNI